MNRKKFRCAALTLPLLAAAVLAGASAAQGQESANEASVQPEAPQDDADRLFRIEQHLRTLEAHNQQLQKRYDNLSRQYQKIVQQGNDPVFGAGAGNTDGTGVPGGIPYRRSSFVQKNDDQDSEGDGENIGVGRQRTYGPEDSDEDDDQETTPTIPPPLRRQPRRQSGLGGAGQAIGEAPRQSMENYVSQLGDYEPNMRPPRIPATVTFREGLEIRSSDDFFTLEFHNLTQTDGRLFSNTGDALHDNFIIPRQRWYFQGQVTPFAYYYTNINRGYGSLDMLDSWADLNFWPRYKEQMQIRVGRMKTPYTYEYIKISESDLIAPERSLFVGNFAGNRQEGIMAHGELFERVMEYYLGVFNGPRRSFQDYNNSKDIYSFLNFKPFLHGGFEWLEQLNVGGSFNAGNENNPLQPSILTTANDQSTSASVENVSPTFLEFNNNAIENGMRMQWSGDLAYYYKSFTLTGGYQGGFEEYSLVSTPVASNKIFQQGSTAFVGYGSSKRTSVPLEGWDLALTYFITGEEITRRVYLLEPKRPFGFYNGRLNPGAIELYARFSDLQVGSQIFTGGLADPHLWSNRANATDTGVNWYLSNYVRIYLDWQHAMFGSPVFLGVNKFTKDENLYWLRTQIFF
jgi:phosphate-selective porin OprO/OprP